MQPFVMQDRPMKGWLRVEAASLASDDALSTWAQCGLGHAASLPPKQPPSAEGRITA